MYRAYAFSSSLAPTALEGVHESPRIFETNIQKMRVQGAKRPCRGLGCPQKPLVPLLLAAAGGEQGEKKDVRGHPAPRQRAAALCNPASQAH